VPFVRGLALTGSVAAGDAGDGDDVDLLVVVAPGRVATVFLVLGTLSRLTRRRFFCPNYYLAAGRLAVFEPNAYTARELVQARWLWGGEVAMHEANPWLLERFPNAAADPRTELRATRQLQDLLERPLSGRAGARLERWAERIARSRLAAHYGRLGRVVPPDVERELEAGAAIRFHGRTVAETTAERYRARRAEVAALLRNADGAA